MSSETTIFSYFQNNLRTGQPSSLTGALPEPETGLGVRLGPWCSSWLWKRPSCSSAWSVHTSTVTAFSCQLLMPTSRHSFRASESSARQVSSCRKNKLKVRMCRGSTYPLQVVWNTTLRKPRKDTESRMFKPSAHSYLKPRRKQDIQMTLAYSPTGHSLELCCWSDLGSPHILAWERK